MDLVGTYLPIREFTDSERREPWQSATKQTGRTVVELDPPVREALVKHCGLSGRSITWVVNKAVKEFLDSPTSALIALPRTRMVNQAVVKFLEQEERPE